MSMSIKLSKRSNSLTKKKEYYVVVTSGGSLVCETFSPSRKKTLARYKEKWLRHSFDPDMEWNRRRKRGYKVAKANQVL